jgi:hypothetical protein
VKTLQTDFNAYAYENTQSKPSTACFNTDLFEQKRLQPTSLFNVPYWLKYDLLQGEKLFCHNHVPMYKRTLDQTRDFVARMHNMKRKFNITVPFFAFNMFDHETHDELTLSRGYDRYLKETIEMLETKGYLNNTMLMLMSDHGSRLTGKSFFIYFV